MADVVIAGYGPAGAAAAIAAHDAGRSVLILESAERGGGNARYSGGFLFDVPGDAAVAHLDALCFGRTGRRVLEAYAAGLHELDGWLRSLGGDHRPVRAAAGPAARPVPILAAPAGRPSDPVPDGGRRHRPSRRGAVGPAGRRRTGPRHRPDRGDRGGTPGRGVTAPVRRVAVVTGGAGAIGGSVATVLTATGHRVLILDRTGDVPVDLADEQQVRTAAQRVLDEAGRCDVLVHAAAAFDRSDLDLAVWRRVQAVNVESALLLAQAFVPGMTARGFGRIIFVVSDTVWAPPAEDLLPYVTSKGALVALARALAMAHGPDGIAVTCVAPGLTDTPAARADLPAAAFDAVRARQALPRALRPDDVAATVAFLASDGAAALTGQVLCTDGGLVMR